MQKPYLYISGATCRKIYSNIKLNTTAKFVNSETIPALSYFNASVKNVCPRKLVAPEPKTRRICGVVFGTAKTPLFQHKKIERIIPHVANDSVIRKWLI